MVHERAEEVEPLSAVDASASRVSFIDAHKTYKLCKYEYEMRCEIASEAILIWRHVHLTRAV